MDANRISRKRSRKQEQSLSNWSHDGYVLGLAWSRCGHYLYSVGTDKRLRAWDWNWGQGINMKTRFPQLMVPDNIGDTYKNVQMETTEEALIALSENIAVMEQSSGSLKSGQYLETVSQNHSCFSYNF